MEMQAACAASRHNHRSLHIKYSITHKQQTQQVVSSSGSGASARSAAAVDVDVQIAFCEDDLYSRRGRASSSECARSTGGPRGDSAAAARGEHVQRGARAHSHPLRPHASHTAAARCSRPRRRARVLGLRTHGSPRTRLSALFRSTSLILRHGSPSTGRTRSDASGEDRSLRVTGRNGEGAGEGAGESARERAGEGAGQGEGAREASGEARGRSECERARGAGSRLAGVTSLRERRWMRRRTPAGESVSVTLMLMLCARRGLRGLRAADAGGGGGGGAGSGSARLSRSREVCGLAGPLALDLLGPARLGPAPAS
ncbi:uncharacterized protein LOC123721676 [Papilio machaon]|uniref:uncharacterized protein LOC123721676 n=1 Tax=Papilio machaon TaxID=76193 RepID=UPI001E665ABC|nr:uncharacterized protein LOC123721676 [Papilio machaon]